MFLLISVEKSLLQKQLSFNASQYSLFLFDTMEIYAQMLPYSHDAKIVWIILI